MTGLEIAACAFHQVPVILIILDNSGYGTQRPILDGPFNDIPSLAAEHLALVMDRGRGHHATTEAELDTALATAVQSDTVEIIRVSLPKGATSQALGRLGAALKERV